MQLERRAAPDPEYAPLIAAAAPAMQIDLDGAPPLQVARRMRLAQVPPAALPDPDVSWRDEEIPGPHGSIPLRIYRPRGAGRGALVNFHGGGWVIGSIHTDHPRCAALAKAAGITIVSVQYRLAPEHRFPVPLEDAYAATLWVAAQADELGIDASRIAVGGASAGANLAAALCHMARDRGGFQPAFQHLLFPVTDADFSRASYEIYDGVVLTRRAMQWFWDQYDPAAQARRNPYAAPLHGNLAGLPPALIQTAELDPLRDEAEEYALRLSKAGIAVTCTRYPGVPHGFVGFGPQLRAAAAAIAEAAGMLRG